MTGEIMPTGIGSRSTGVILNYRGAPHNNGLIKGNEGSPSAFIPHNVQCKDEWGRPIDVNHLKKGDLVEYNFMKQISKNIAYEIFVLPPAKTPKEKLVDLP
jgi:hypothetical protein